MSHTDVPIQALRSEYDVVILEHEDKEWRVDLEKMIQKPVNQPFMKHRWRHVRYLVQESNQASRTYVVPDTFTDDSETSPNSSLTLFDLGESFESPPTQVTG